MKKKYKDKWQSGNGTMLMGIVIMFSMLVLTYGAVQTFLIQNNGWNAQLASDSIADGTAVYMATDGDDYNDATQKASKLQKLVKDITGYDIQNVTVNKSKLEDDDEVEVKLNLKDQYIRKNKNGQDYSITRTSVTKFNKNGIASGSLLGIAESKLGAPYYWAKQGPDEFDCSGFVYWCYKQAGATGGYKNTFALIAKFAGTKYEVTDKNDLQPGDMILCNAGNHVVLYYGNGKVIVCSGGGRNTLGNNPNAYVKIQDYEKSYKHSTTNIFRFPVEAY